VPGTDYILIKTTTDIKGEALLAYYRISQRPQSSRSGFNPAISLHLDDLEHFRDRSGGFP
jgi:hypothetical protein